MSKIRFQRLSDAAKKPHRAHDSAGYDLFATRSVQIAPGQVARVKTDIAIELDPETFGLLRDRSSLGSKGIVITAGVIDPDYRGEIQVCIHNTTQSFFMVQQGDKIAQMLILNFKTPELVETDQLTETTRGSDGFGSTNASSK